LNFKKPREKQILHPPRKRGVRDDIGD